MSEVAFGTYTDFGTRCGGTAVGAYTRIGVLFQETNVRVVTEIGLFFKLKTSGYSRPNGSTRPHVLPPPPKCPLRFGEGDHTHIYST